jgi:hypothetical protein
LCTKIARFTEHIPANRSESGFFVVQLSLVMENFTLTAPTQIQSLPEWLSARQSRLRTHLSPSRKRDLEKYSEQFSMTKEFFDSTLGMISLMNLSIGIDSIFARLTTNCCSCLQGERQSICRCGPTPALKDIFYGFPWPSQIEFPGRFGLPKSVNLLIVLVGGSWIRTKRKPSKSFRLGLTIT